VDHGLHHGVAEYDFSEILDCRIVVEHRFDIGEKQTFDLWQ
jgi:hypothetical protein